MQVSASGIRHSIALRSFYASVILIGSLSWQVSVAQSPLRKIECDSIATRYWSDVLFGSEGNSAELFRLSFSETDGLSFTKQFVFRGKNSECVEADYDWRRIVFDDNKDSIDVIIFQTFDLDVLLRDFRWLAPQYYTDIQMAIFHWSDNEPVRKQLVSIGETVFPQDIKQCGGGNYTIRELSILDSLGQSLPILTAVVENFCMGNHPHQFTRQGFWRLTEQSTVYMGAVFRDWYTVGGAEDSESMKGDLRFSDIDDDGIVEMLYRSKTGYQYWGRHSQTLDPGDFVFEIRHGAIVPIAIRDSLGQKIRIRPFLPTIVYPCSVTCACPPQTMSDSLIAINCNYLGSSSIPLSTVSDDDVRELDSSYRDRITARFWFERDSIRVNIQTKDSCTVVLWFDTDLQRDFTTSFLTGDERLVVVRITGNPDKVGIQACAAEVNAGRIHLKELGGLVEVPSSGLSDGGVSFRLGEDITGFVQRVGPIAIGFGIEVFPYDTDVVLVGPRAVSAYPPGLNREDPRTWATLVKGIRIDTVYSHPNREK